MAGVALAAALALLLAPPAGAGEPTRARPGVSSASSLPAETVEAIRQAVTDEMSRLGIPGLSLAVAQGGEVRHEAGLGFADVENEVPARPETAYRLASVSKPITAAAVLRLAEEARHPGLASGVLVELIATQIAIDPPVLVPSRMTLVGSCKLNKCEIALRRSSTQPCSEKSPSLSPHPRKLNVIAMHLSSCAVRSINCGNVPPARWASSDAIGKP